MSHRLFVFTGTLLVFHWKIFGLDIFVDSPDTLLCGWDMSPGADHPPAHHIVYGLLGYDIGTSNGTIRMNQWTLSRFLGRDS